MPVLVCVPIWKSLVNEMQESGFAVHVGWSSIWTGTIMFGLA